MAARSSGTTTIARLSSTMAREAPGSWGPTTHAALERCVELWEQAKRRIAIVAASNDPLQVLGELERFYEPFLRRRAA